VSPSLVLSLRAVVESGGGDRPGSWCWRSIGEAPGRQASGGQRSNSRYAAVQGVRSSDRWRWRTRRTGQLYGLNGSCGARWLGPERVGV